MKPISMYDAKPGQPFTVKHGGTVRDLRDILTYLCELGYGGTNIMRADSEAGPASANTLELYNTEHEQKTGSLDCDSIFLIC